MHIWVIGQQYVHAYTILLFVYAITHSLPNLCDLRLNLNSMTGWVGTSVIRRKLTKTLPHTGLDWEPNYNTYTELDLNRHVAS